MNTRGQTTVIKAAVRGHSGCLQLLLEAGADVIVTDGDVNTALHRTRSVKPHILPSVIQCQRMLLRAGININVTNEVSMNAVSSWQQDEVYLKRYKRLKLLLIAAGEKQEVKQEVEQEVEQDVALNLKHLCRETIRKHLLELDPHTHLFCRVPGLGLPTIITDYLLYNQPLDDDQQDVASSVSSASSSSSSLSPEWESESESESSESESESESEWYEAGSGSLYRGHGNDNSHDSSDDMII